jgi:hypothetical protein
MDRLPAIGYATVAANWPIPGELLGHFFLSAKGYEALGYTKGEIACCFEEKSAVIGGCEVVSIKFCDGMEGLSKGVQ